MEHGSENNGTLIDTLSLILAMFQLLICNLHQYFFVVPDKDCDIAVEILRTLVMHLIRIFKCFGNLVGGI